MNWIAYIFDRLYLLWPLRIVHSYERGVRFWMGDDVAELEPGCYLFLPFFGSIDIVTVVPDVMHLPTQSVTTLDGQSVSFSCNIAFEIVSARKMYTKVQDFHASLDGITMGHLASRVRSQLWETLQANQDALEEDMKKTLQKEVTRWGVKVLSVRITDLVKSRQFRLFGDTMMGMHA